MANGYKSRTVWILLVVGKYGGHGLQVYFGIGCYDAQLTKTITQITELLTVRVGHTTEVPRLMEHNMGHEVRIRKRNVPVFTQKNQIVLVGLPLKQVKKVQVHLDMMALLDTDRVQVVLENKKYYFANI